MTRRRSTYDAMKPLDKTSWLLVQNQFRQTLKIEALPPGTDPRVVMIRALARSIEEGYEVEELPGDVPLYFCRKGEQRLQVSIARSHPDESRVSPTKGWQGPKSP